MRSRLRLIGHVVGSVALLFSFAGPLSAEDGASLYKQLCASCHDTGFDRAPDRDALRAMSPERVLAALESGPMISMASGRTGVERRAIAEFVTGKSFGQALEHDAVAAGDVSRDRRVASPIRWPDRAGTAGA